MAYRARGAVLTRWLSRYSNSSRRYSTRPKFYKEKPKYYKDVAQTYAKFRREVSELRKEFREEWLEQQRMTQTQFSAKAADEARQKEMEEARAFEAAATELERMSKNREAAEQRSRERKRLQREEGDASRLQREETLSQVLAKKIEHMENETRSSITADNLNDKIEEALANEVLDDFIISAPTGKIKTLTFKNLP